MISHQIPQRWLHPGSLEEATAVQRELAGHVVREDRLNPVHCVAGADVSNNLQDPENIYASLVTLSYPELAPIEEASVRYHSEMPYIPGFLAFREVPALVQAYQALKTRPDLILVDGHGVSHPRGLGIASHLGVLLDSPTIGVAKSILVGKPDGELGPEPGDRVPLVWKGRAIGMVLRTRRNVQPVYVAVGHRISLESAVDWVLRCQSRYRLPEPTRKAHQAANEYRKLGADTANRPDAVLQALAPPP